MDISNTTNGMGGRQATTPTYKQQRQTLLSCVANHILKHVGGTDRGYYVSLLILFIWVCRKLRVNRINPDKLGGRCSPIFRMVTDRIHVLPGWWVVGIF